MRLRSRRRADQRRISRSSHCRTSSRCASSARTSGIVICGSFFPQSLPLQPQKPQGQHRQRGVMMPTAPAPRLILVQTAFSFACLEALLDRPVAATHLGQLLQRLPRRRVAAMVFHFRLLSYRTADQQQLARPGQAFLAEPHPQLGVLEPARALAALGHHQTAPRLRRQLGHHVIDAPRFSGHPRLHRHLPFGHPRPGRDHFRLGLPDACVGSPVRHIPLVQRPHPLHEHRTIPVDAVAGHPAERQAALGGAGHHRQGQLRLAPEDGIRGNSRGPAARGVVHPLLRHEQTPVDQRVAPRAAVVHEDTDLAVVGAAQTAGVLPLHTDRLGAFLRDAGFIDVEASLGIAEHFTDMALQRFEHVVVLPGREANELLQRADHAAVDRLGNVLGVAAFAAQEQPLHEAVGMGLGLLLAKQRGIALQEGIQFGLEPPEIACVHASLLQGTWLSHFRVSPCSKIRLAVEDQLGGRCSINWGDGTTSSGTVSGGNGAFTVTGSHTYADEGAYHLSVLIQDDGGASATAQEAVAWAPAASTPDPLYAPATAAGADGRIYVIGGYDYATYNYSNATEVYDPST